MNFPGKLGYILHDKAEVPKTIIQFLKYIKNHFQYNN